MGSGENIEKIKEYLDERKISSIRLSDDIYFPWSWNDEKGYFEITLLAVIYRGFDEKKMITERQCRAIRECENVVLDEEWWSLECITKFAATAILHFAYSDKKQEYRIKITDNIDIY